MDLLGEGAEGGGLTNLAGFLRVFPLMVHSRIQPQASRKVLSTPRSWEGTNFFGGELAGLYDHTKAGGLTLPRALIPRKAESTTGKGLTTAQFEVPAESVQASGYLQCLERPVRNTFKRGYD